MPATFRRRCRVSTPRPGRSGLTVVEVLIVLLIVSALLAIAIPNFVRARAISHAHSCIANLRQIEEAKGQWGLEHRVAATGVAPAETELFGPDGYLHVTPRCPSGGTYTIGDLSTPPTCSFGASEMPAHRLP